MNASSLALHPRSMDGLFSRQAWAALVLVVALFASLPNT